MKFTYSRQEQRTALDFGLLGPSGFRGWSGGDKEGFTLSLSDATPSYLPGPIEPAPGPVAGSAQHPANVTSQFAAEVYFDRSPQDERKDPTAHLEASGPDRLVSR